MMSIPEPMRCHLDECPHWFRCHSAGGCREAQKDAAACYDLAHATIRERRLRTSEEVPA